MKHFAVLLLCAACAVICFSGCGRQKEEPTTAPAQQSTSLTTEQNNENTGSESAKISLKEAEELYEKKAEEYKNSKYPIGVIVMENGDTMVLELYSEYAPNTVNNFISLANKGYYDGVIFHRCVQDFVIQGGDPMGTGRGGPGYQIEGEFANNGHTENTLSHGKGIISMARKGNYYDPASAYNTAGSQFFICVSDGITVKNLDKDYAAFGKVIEGYEYAEKIVNQPTDANDKPLTEQKMLLIRVATYDFAVSEPVTLPD